MIVYPNKEKHNIKCLKEYGKMFLDLNLLKVGDTIQMDFSYQQIHRNGKEESTVTFSKPLPGVVKKDINGVIYIESKEELQYYKRQSWHNSSRSYKSWYEGYKKKGVIVIGTGFMHYTPKTEKNEI